MKILPAYGRLPRMMNFGENCADAVNCYNVDKKRTGKLNLKIIFSKFMTFLSHTVDFNILCIMFYNFVQVLHAEARWDSF